MIESILIFLASGIILFFLIRWLVKSETEPVDVEQKLKLYGGSNLFEAHYSRHAFKKLSYVIKSFEKKFPHEVAKILNQKKENERFFVQNRDRYNYLIFKYQEELTDLRATGASWFSRADLRKHFEDKALNQLVEGHVINCYNEKYHLKEKYEAEHPFELDENGRPLKVEI